MNKDQMIGKLENLKGRVKEALGTASGNKETEVEGFAERVKGAVQKTVGDIKQAFSRHEPEEEEDELDSTRRRDDADDAPRQRH
jgi:uncharacterized protein YjbJ (UPF0337 family)